MHSRVLTLLRSRRAAIALLMIGLASGCAPREPKVVSSGVPRAAIEEVPSPVSFGSVAPHLSAVRDGVLLSWLEPEGAGRFALVYSRYSAGRWSVPRTVVERDDFLVDGPDAPSVVEDERGTLFAYWLQKSDARAATSTDGGATWSEPFHGTMRPRVDAVGRRAVTAWFRAADDGPRVFAAFSDDAGATFAKPIRIDDGKPVGRVAGLLLDERTALVTWVEQTDAGGEIRARRADRGGRRGPSLKIADAGTAPGKGLTRMARFGPDVYLMWTEQGPTGVHVHFARGRF